MSIEPRLDELRRFGMPEDEIAKVRADLEKDESQDFEVWPEHQDAVQVFLAMEHQWQKRLIGKRLIYDSLRYEALKTVVWGLEIAMNKTLFRDLQTMERAALEILNKQS